VSREIERKYRVSAIPDWLSECPSEEIEQGYVTSAAADETEVRVRRTGKQEVLTVKRGHGRVREETELALSAEQADELWPLTEGRRIRKRRYRVDRDGTTIEVDVFADELDGLALAEIEFPSEEASDAFEPPGWLGRELTGERDYSNEHLAEYGMPEEPR
jgi:adenylate cyclase